MNCPNCGLYVEAVNTGICPRCGRPLTGSTPANAGGYGNAMDAFSQSPTMFSNGPFPPSTGGYGENYGAPFPSQSMPPSAPIYGPGPGAPAGYPAPPPPGWMTSPPPAPPPPGWMTTMPPAPPPRKSRSGLIIGILLIVAVVLVGGLGVTLLALNTHNQQGPTGVGATATAPLTTPSPTPTPSETIVFQDPLTTNANDWANDSHCFFKNNSYHVKDGYICYAPIGEISDANFSVDAKQVSGPLTWFYGIAFRRVSKGNLYAFYIDGNGKWLFSKYVNDTRTDILPYVPNNAIKRGLNAINTLLVRAKGSHFEFFVNGTKVGEADDSTFSSGYSGVEGGSGGIEVAFNNFKITTSS